MSRLKDPLTDVVRAIFLLSIIAILALSCPGCGVNPEVSFVDRMVIDRASTAWEMARMPDAKDCLDDVGVGVLSRESFLRTCGRPSFFHVGCVVDRGIGFHDGKVIYLSPDVPPSHRSAALVHMTFHALFICTSKSDRDVADNSHMKPDVWVESSRGTSLEQFVVDGL